MIRSFSSRPRRARHRRRARSSSDNFLIDDSSLYGATNQKFLDFANRMRRIQSLRTDVGAIHDGMATEQTVWIFKVIQTRTGGFIAAIRSEEHTSELQSLIRIPSAVSRLK